MHLINIIICVNVNGKNDKDLQTIINMKKLLTWFRENYIVLPKHVELSKSIANTKKLIPILCERKRDLMLEIKNKFNINHNMALIQIEIEHNTMLMYSNDGEWILNILPRDTMPLRYKKFIKDVSNILINRKISRTQLTINFMKSNISRQRFIDMLLEYDSSKTVTPDVILDFVSQTQILQPYFDIVVQYVTPYMIIESVISQKKNNN